jgi:Rieske Fe-S protein
MMMTQQTREKASASRRAVLAGAGAAAIVVLSGCTTYGQNAPADDAAEAADDGDDAGGATAPGAPAPLASTKDIPVGGGKVFEQRRMVITQPQQGTFKAFSAVCTHAGCVVAEVKNGTINCPCHGSRFKAADGSVAAGPASSALKPVAITVTGDQIRLA